MSNQLSMGERLDIATEMMTERQYDEYLEKVEKAEEKKE